MVELLNLINMRKSTLKFIVEPWGRSYDWLPLETIIVELSPDASGKKIRHLVEIEDEAVTLYVDGEYEELCVIVGGIEVANL